MMKTLVLFLAIVLSSLDLHAQLRDSLCIAPEKLSLLDPNGFNEGRLPFVIRSFVIPAGALVTDFQVRVTRRTYIEGTFSLDSVQPSLLAASLTFDGEVQGYRVVTISYCPFEYISATKELYLRNIFVMVDYVQNGPLPASPKISYTRALLAKGVVKSLVENSEDVDFCTNNLNIVPQSTSLNKDVRNTLSRSVSAIEETVPDFIIITCDSLKETFRTLADWKIKRGIPTLIETTEKIAADYAGSDMAEKIRNYLRTVKNRWNANSLFILLGGGPEIVPSRMGKSTKYSNEKFPSDLYFIAESDTLWDPSTACFENTDSVTYYLGRIPARNKLEAQQLIAKILSYEKADKKIDYSYLKNGLAVAGFHDIARDGSSVYYSGADRNKIDEYCKKSGYDFRYLFDHYNCTLDHHDEVPTYDKNKCKELNRHNFLSDLQDGRNSKKFHFIYHIDHSYFTNMGASQRDKGECITNQDVDNIIDSPYPQIIMTNGCRPACFDRDCIAEHFLNKPLGGVVAFIGNTGDGATANNYRVSHFLTSLFETESVCKEQYSLGYLLNKLFVSNVGGTLRFDSSKLEYYTYGGYDTSSRDWKHHLLGDPTMPVWTDIPQNLNVSVTPQAIVSGENRITVQVRNLPAGKQAMICLMKGEEGYANLLVDDTQPHTFTFTPRTSGVLDVTVTAHNFRPYETTIPVQVNENSAVYISDLVFDDDKIGNSIGNGDKQLDAGETIELTMTLKNNSNIAMNGIKSILSCNSYRFIRFRNNESNFGAIFSGGTAQCTVPFVFQIDPNTPNIRRSDINNLKFTVEIRNSTNSIISTDTFKIDVFAPELKIGCQTVSTTMIPGVYNLNIDLTNIGKAKATGLKAILEPDGNNSYVSFCSHNFITFPDISRYASVSNSDPFQFRLKDTYRDGYPQKMKLTVTNEFNKQWIFHLDPSDVCDPINSTTVECESYAGAVELRWESVRGAAGYEVYRGNYPDRVFTRLTKLPVTDTYYRDEKAIFPGYPYYYKIRVISSSGNASEFSEPVLGKSSFALMPGFPVAPRYNSNVSQVAVADIDDDGYKEMVVTGNFRYTEYENAILSAVDHTGKYIFAVDDSRYDALASFPAYSRGVPAIGNLGADGIPYIVTATWQDGSYRNIIAAYSVYDKNGGKEISERWRLDPLPSYFRGPVLANVDNSTDGSMEVIVKTHEIPTLEILDNQSRILSQITIPTSYSYPAVADLDRDGTLELVAVNAITGGFTIFDSNGLPFTDQIYAEGIFLSSPVVCDLNRNGKKDIIVAEKGTDNVRIFVFDYNGNLLSGWDGTQTIPYTAIIHKGLDKMISAGDINGDGYPEVVALGKEKICAWNYRGMVCLNKTVPKLTPNTETPILADIDGDSQADIIYYVKDKLYAINGVSGNLIPGFPLQANNDLSGNPCVADIDYDGLSELVAVDADGYIYAWKTHGKPAGIEWGSERHDSRNTGEYGPVCESTVIRSNTAWNGETPCGNVIVRSGHLTIPTGKNLTMDKKALLVVRPGASLVVDGGTIQNACIHALPGSTVTLKNNGTIRLRGNGKFTLDLGATLNQEHGTITP